MRMSQCMLIDHVLYNSLLTVPALYLHNALVKENAVWALLKQRVASVVGDVDCLIHLRSKHVGDIHFKENLQDNPLNLVF